MVRVLLFAMLGWAAASGLNPITRVAQLLEGMADKVKADGKNEQDLYDGFKCWCTKVINSKSASIEANQQRVNELAAYIDDLSSGRVELTSERSTLEDEIKKLKTEITDTTNLRAQEKGDYDSAKDELDKSITALEGAVSTMTDATADMKEGVFLTSVHTQLKKVMKVGKTFMSEGAVARLRKVLEVPEADWNDLNQDATHKMKYKNRSGEIQDILGEMLTTFKDNRDEAVSAEVKAVESFTALMSSKNDLLDSAELALNDKAGENGARGQSLQQCVAEKENLETQNGNDETFIGQTKTSCATKADEWSARKELRAGELAAIGGAIATLRSDDARDLFGKSFSSQSFLQTRRVVHPRRHAANRNAVQNRNAAASLMRRTGVKSGDLRLLAMASKVNGDGDEADPLDFSSVTLQLDNMLATLKTEEEDDMTRKEMCEMERARNNNKVTMLSKNIDTNTETVDRLSKEIDAANKRIEDTLQQIADLNTASADADTQRGKEAVEYTTAKSDDEAAVEVVKTATKVLEDFYKNNELNLLQQKLDTTPAPAADNVGTGGEAPTPPPSTWGDGDASGYGGATGEAGGIIQMMEAIQDDITKDISKADADELDAKNAHNALTLDIQNSISSLQEMKGELDGEVATKTSARTLEKEARTGNQDETGATLTFLKSIASGCDFMMKNFETRKTNRQAEVDGLGKAKSIFAGADFR